MDKVKSLQQNVGEEGKQHQRELKVQCERILEDHEDEVVRLIRQVEGLRENICIHAAALCSAEELESVQKVYLGKEREAGKATIKPSTGSTSVGQDRVEKKNTMATKKKKKKAKADKKAAEKKAKADKKAVSQSVSLC